jgi:hypothetical protein
MCRTTLVILLMSLVAQADSLEQAFRSPPDSAKPHIWWHWMNGNISRDGITWDLEAMAAAGLGGCYTFDVGLGLPGPVGFNDNEYLGLLRFAAEEAKRLGLEFGIHNCNGWSASGGPWVKPEHAMKEVVFSEITVDAENSKLPLTLPPLPMKEESKKVMATGWSKTIAVYAWPVSATQNAKKLNFYDQYDNPSEFKPGKNLGKLQMEAILNLTDKLDGDTLHWKPEAGEWLVLRLGTTTIGKMNAPARQGGVGLEVDKLSSESFDHFWDGYLKNVVSKMGELNGNGFNYLIIDSFEKGPQNWTANMIKEFKDRRGYDPTMWLPALAGYAVNGREQTARFIWDYRRTISDLLIENYDGRMKERAAEHGLKLSIENYHAFADNLARAKHADMTMGEFWLNEHMPREKGWGMPDRIIRTCKFAASTAHIYGVKLVGAESFTARAKEGRWTGHPYKWKGLGDFAFLEGVNRHVFHRYVHQAYKNLVPGQAMQIWGSHFDVGNSIWPMIHSYFEYLQRCQTLLQQGDFIADIALYAGDHIPVKDFGDYNYDKKVPAGYDYDLLTQDVLHRAKTNNDGQLELLSGMRYRALFLPKNATVMPLETLMVLENLVQGGLRLYGPMPEISPSLEGGPESDEKLKSIVARMWPSTGNCKQYGKGWVFSDGSVEEIVGIIPDVSIPESLAKNMGYIHRRVSEDGNETDLYFVANHNGEKPQQLDLVFRNRGKLPEIWHPTKKEIVKDVPFTRMPDGWCKLSLSFAPYESFFVVFRKDEPALYVSKAMPDLEEKTVLTLDSPWVVTFLPNHITGENWGPEGNLVMKDLKSLHLHEYDEVKFFSGQVAYSSSFNFERKSDQSKKLYLDLGESEVISEVWVNGKQVDTLWMKPLQVEIDDYLKAGKNRIEITVSTRLINRLIGDEYYPEDLNYIRWEHPSHGKLQFLSERELPDWIKNGIKRPNSARKTFSFTKFYTKEAPLFPAGLLGPVRIIERNCNVVKAVN